MPSKASITLRRLCNALISLSLCSGAGLAQTPAPGAGPAAEPPAIIISIDDKGYLINDQPVADFAALQARLVAESNRAIPPKFYLWAWDDDRLFNAYPVLLALNGTRVRELGLIAEPMSSESASRATTLADAVVLTRDLAPHPRRRTGARAVEVILDFDCSIYWQNEPVQAQTDLETRLAALTVRTNQPEINVRLNPLAGWTCVVDLISEIQAQGVTRFRLTGPEEEIGDGPLEPRLLHQELFVTLPAVIGKNITLFDAIFDGSDRAAGARSRKMRMSYTIRTPWPPRPEPVTIE